LFYLKTKKTAVFFHKNFVKDNDLFAHILNELDMIRMQSVLPLLSLCIFYATQIFAQTPCSGGMANGYPCSNIDLLATMDLAALSSFTGTTASGANDIWGWTSPNTSKEYAIVGLRTGTSFVDVSTPTAPILVGHLPTASTLEPNNIWRDIKVVGNYAYISSEADGHQLQTFDLTKLDNATNLPVLFTQDGNPFIYSNGNSHNVFADPIAGYVGTIGSENSAAAGGGMVFFDIASNAANPSISGTFSPPAGGSDNRYSHDAICVTYHGSDTEHIGKQICFGFNENIVVAADVTDKANTIYLGNTSYSGIGYTHQGWISDDHQYLYLNDELDERNTGNNTRTHILDISDLDNMVPISGTGYYESSFKAIDHNLYIRGNYMYQSNYRAGLRIIDIQDKEVPVEVAYFDVFPNNDNNQFNGAWSVYPYFKSGIVLINSIEDGLFIVQPNLAHYVMENIGTGIQSVCSGTNANFPINLDSYAGFGGNVSLAVTGNPAGSSSSFPASVASNGSATISITNTNMATAGSYQIVLNGNNGMASEEELSLGLIIKPDPSASILQLPVDAATDISIAPMFTWNAADDTDTYNFEIATDASFNNIVTTQPNLTNVTTSISGLNNDQTYYWRITSVNDCNTQVSPVFSFTTSALLPVELIHFSATPKRKSIFLNWTTATEINNKGFEIQRTTSERPNDFQFIGWIDGQGESSIEQNYAFDDTDVEIGILYLYRLKQLDVDGTAILSEIISSKIQAFEEMISVFPNPVEAVLNVKFDAFDLPLHNILLRIVSVNGQILKEEKLTILPDDINYQLPTDNLSPGVYFIEFSLANEIFRKRFVKQ